MERCVVTLPITPVANPSLGLIASIMVGDFVARRLKLKLVLALGPQKRLESVDREKTVNCFLKALEYVGIRPDYVWRSDSSENITKTSELFNVLIEKSLVVKQDVLVDICPCGTVEKLSEAMEWNEKRKLYETKDGNSQCKLCNGVLRKEEKQVYRFSFKDSMVNLEPHPCFYEKEIGSLTKSFLSSGPMVSRSRESSVKIVTREGEIVNVDQDFAWQMYQAVLPTLGLDPLIVLGSNHNLWALVLIGALRQALTSMSPLRVIIPPYFLGEGRKSFGPEHKAFALSEVHFKNSIRLLIGASLNWSQKESVIQTGQLPLFDKMSKRLEAVPVADTKILDIQEFLEKCEYRKIRNAIKSARGNKVLLNHDSLCGILDQAERRAN